MKKNTLVKLALLAVLSLALTACGAVPPLSWPGITVDEASERVYLAYQGKVIALNSQNGVPVWEYPSGNDRNFSVFAAPALEGDQLYLGSYNNSLYRLNAASGVEAWTFEGAEGKYIGELLVADGRIYASNTDHNLYALDSDGTLLWSYTTGQPQWGQPALGDGVLYVSSLDHNLYAVNAADGSRIWATDLGGTLVNGPLLHEGRLYTGTFNSEVLAVNAAGGNVEWRFATQGWVWGTPTLHEGQLLVGDLEGFLYSLDPATGTENWRVDTGGSITGSPLVLNEHIYVINEAGRVLSVNLAGGILWNQDFATELYGSAVAAGNLILIGQHDNTTTLVAVNESGTRVWSYPQP